jgi:amidase/aspartyl-tRNA(Asn)/glutamyl-tRNA(Gln) amidotransferase subunit A
MTFPINFTGHPAISVPAGFTPEGLPVGLQIVGRRHADETVLALASRFERMLPWFQDYPGLVSDKPAP